MGPRGRQSLARSAVVEAAAQLCKGLALLPNLPENSERSRNELELQSTLGAALVASVGNSAPETGQAYARARELGEQLGDTAALVPVLSGLATHHQTRGEYVAMREIADDLLCLGERGATLPVIWSAIVPWAFVCIISASLLRRSNILSAYLTSIYPRHING